MLYFFIKTGITALIIAATSELARRYSLFASLIVSLPLTSILAFIWIYYESKNPDKIIEMSYQVFWLVLPSLLFFIALPLIMRAGIGFPLAMLISSVIMIIGYSITTYLLSH